MKGRGGRFGEPRSRTPIVVDCLGHQAVFDRIVLDVVEAGQRGFLVGEWSVEIVVPDLPSGGAIEVIEEDGGVAVEVGEPRGKRLLSFRWREGDKVIVVSPNGPGLRFPSVFFSSPEEEVTEKAEAFSGTQMMLLPVGACRHDVSPGGETIVGWGVRPRD